MNNKNYFSYHDIYRKTHTISPVVEQVLLGQNSLCACTGHHAVHPNRVQRVKCTQEQPQ